MMMAVHLHAVLNLVTLASLVLLQLKIFAKIYTGMGKNKDYPNVMMVTQSMEMDVQVNA